MNELKHTTNEFLDKIDFSNVKTIEEMKQKIPKDIIIDIPNLKLGIVNEHPRDKYLLFTEKNHYYFLFDPETQKYVKGMKSITGIVGSKHEEFNGRMVIAKNKSKWALDPTSEYHNKTEEQIMNQWDTENKLGTFLHRQIELKINGVLDQHPEGIEECTLNIDFQYFLNFDRDVMQKLNWTCWRTEWRIYSAKYKACGTIDCVIIPDKSRPNEVIIYDWKRTKKLEEIDPEEHVWKYMKAPLKMLPDTKIMHYKLQLNLYKIILEEEYNLKVIAMYLGVFHPTNQNKNYKTFKIEEEYGKYAQILLNQRL